MGKAKRNLLNLLQDNYTLRNQVYAKAEYLRVEQAICGYLEEIRQEEDARRFVQLYLEQREEVLEAREHNRDPAPMLIPTYAAAIGKPLPLFNNRLYGDLMLVYLALVRDMRSTVTAMQLTYDAAYKSIAGVFNQYNIQFLPDSTAITMTVGHATSLLLDMAYRNIVNQLFIEHIRPHIGRQSSHEHIDALLPRLLISDRVGQVVNDFRAQHGHTMRGATDEFYHALSTPLDRFCCETLRHCAVQHVKGLKLDNVVSKIKAVNDKPLDMPQIPRLDDCFKNPTLHPAYGRAEEEETPYQTPRISPDGIA